METEDLTLQIQPQPTPSVHFPKVAVILGGVITSVFVVGAIFYFRNSMPSPKEQLVKNDSQFPTVIYTEPNWGTEFYSLDSDTKEQKQLFSISLNPIGNKMNINGWIPDIKFCAATNKIYIRTTEALKEPILFLPFPPPLYNISVKEIDLKGNIRDLDFTGIKFPYTRNYSNDFYENTDFILSKDCQKIVWSTTYYEKEGEFIEPYESKIFYSDINGGGKKVLQTTKRSRDGDIIKMPVSWSGTDPNVIYLTNYDLKNIFSDGLFKLELNTNSISQINITPANFNKNFDLDAIFDISNNDKFVVHKHDYGEPAGFIEGGFFTNLADQSTVPLKTADGERKKFSPDSSKLAYMGQVCGGISKYGHIIGNCTRNLYVFDTAKKTEKNVLSNLDTYFHFVDWLTNDSVICIRNDKDLIIVNVNDGKETKLAPVSSSFLFVGVLNE